MSIEFNPKVEFRELTEKELDQIVGGWHPFPRGIFGRDGKPFFGRDLVEVVVPVAAGVVATVIPGGAPYAPVVIAVGRKIMEKK